MASSNERIDIVDEKDLVTEYAVPRIGNEHKRHRIVAVMVVNSDNEVIAPLRGLHKRTDPGKYASSVAETLSAGESYESAVIRGLEEELSITKGFNLEPGELVVTTGDNPRNMMLFFCRYDGQVSGWEEEASSIDYLSPSQVGSLMKTSPEKFSDGSLFCYKETVA